MARLSAEDWAQAAVFQLAKGGHESIRVEPLAKTLGVSKGSFYWHFADRQALLDAVVVAWERAGTTAVIDDVDQRAEDPTTRLWALFERAFGAPAELDGIEGAIRSWAAHDSDVQRVVRRVDRRRLRYVAELLSASGIEAEESRRRADLLYCVMIGEFLQRSYGKARLSKQTLQSLREMLLRP